MTTRNTNTQLFRKTKCKRFNYHAVQQHYSNIFMRLLINFQFLSLSLSLSLSLFFFARNFLATVFEIMHGWVDITYCVKFVETIAHFSVSNCSINFTVYNRVLNKLAYLVRMNAFEKNFHFYRTKFQLSWILSNLKKNLFK